jgi:hypothetical protein
MSMSSSPGAVSLPPGVTIEPGRETVQTGPTGAPVQGMLFTLVLPSGAQTSVFVPYALMSNTEIVSQMFAQRVASINAVTSLGG